MPDTREALEARLNDLDREARSAMRDRSTISAKPCEILERIDQYPDALEMFEAYLSRGLPLSKLNFKRPYPRERLLEMLRAPAPGSLAEG